jgi:hypothetical protein
MNSPFTIAEARAKCKERLGKIPRDILIISILILVALLSFGLGYLEGKDVGVGQGSLSVRTSPLINTANDGAVVASKTGTKYYLGWCGGADRITEENKVTFASAHIAEAAGYTPAANCGGL